MSNFRFAVLAGTSSALAGSAILLLDDAERGTSGGGRGASGPMDHAPQSGASLQVLLFMLEGNLVSIESIQALDLHGIHRTSAVS